MRRGLALALGFSLALLPGAVSAHASLVGADPAPGSLISAAPARVTLYFTQPVQAFGRGLTVIGPDGRLASTGRAIVVGSQMSVGLAAPAAGTYLVTWEVIAADSHPSRGSFRFGLGVASVGPPVSVPTASRLGTELEVLARWLHFAGFALGFGGTAFALLVLPARRVERIALAGAGLLLLAEPVALVAQSASFSPDSALDPAAWQDVLASPFGRLLGLRLAAAVLLWALLGWAATAPRFARSGILLVGAGLAVVDAAGAHAQPLLTGPLAVAANAVHVAAVAVWVGGLAALLAAWPVDRAAAARFGRVALAALAIAVVAGAVLGLTELAGLGNALTTAFGLALLAKVGAVGLAVLLAALGRRRLELGAMALVLAAAALVAALPPPVP